MSTFTWAEMKPSRVVKFWKPIFKLATEAIETGWWFGTEAAKYQTETGIAGQTGVGGGPWSPEGVEAEMNWLRTSRVI